MPDVAPALVAMVRDGIAAVGDSARAPQMQAYMTSALPYRGVTAAPLRALLTDLCTRHPLPDRATSESCVLELWDRAGYREERNAAIALASHRL